jgi:adenylate cyclase
MTGPAHAQVHGAAVPRRYAALAVALSLLVGLAYLALRDAPTPTAIEGQTLAWRFALRGTLASPRHVAVAAIDQRTITAMRRSQLQRRDIAAIIDRLVARGATAIGIDLQFAEPEQAADGTTLSPGDQALADALRRSGRSVLALAFTFEPDAAPSPTAEEFAADVAFRVVANATRISPDHTLQATGMLTPIEAVRGTAAMGHVNMPEDSDGLLRTMPAALVLAGHYVPAFPVALAARHSRIDPGNVVLMVDGGLRLGPPESTADIALDSRLRLPINYYGPTPNTVATFSVIDLLQGNVAPELIAGRTVLIGATALALGDQFVTPFGRMPGVEVLATVASNLIAGDLPERAALREWDFAAILLLGLLAFALARLVSPSAVIGVAFGLVAGWFALAQVAFNHGLWLDVTFPAVAILLNAGCVAALRATTERRMRRNLARYHSPNIVDLLAEQATPSFEGRAQNAAILFVDIAGFTGRAEGMSPAATVPLLRAFHARVERAVLAHGGVLERFMGDGALVIFGVPEPSAHDAAAALGCARTLVDDVRRWNRELAGEGQRPLDVSVGIHYGPVVMARLGGDAQAEITPAGDTVNVASRIEKLTRDHDATIAISGAVVAAIVEPERTALMTGFAEVPTQEIHGRVGKIAIWVKPRERASAA